MDEISNNFTLSCLLFVSTVLRGLTSPHAADPSCSLLTRVGRSFPVQQCVVLAGCRDEACMNIRFDAVNFSSKIECIIL